MRPSGETKGVQLDAPQNAEFLALKEAINGFCQDSKRDGLTSKQCEEALPDIKKFEKLLKDVEQLGISPILTEDGGVEFIHACAAQMGWHR